MPGKLIPISRSSRYRGFIADRDAALSVIFNNYLDQVSDVLAFAQDHVSGMVSALGHRKQLTGSATMRHKDELESKIGFVMKSCAKQVFDLAKSMRVSVYGLAYAGEVEGMSRALGKPLKAKLDDHLLHGIVGKDHPAGGDLEARLHHYFDKLRAKVFQAVQHSMILEETTDEALERLARAFPKKKTVRKKKRKVLTPLKLRESADDAPGEESDLYLNRGARASTGFIDDAAWAQVVNDYKAEYVPGRFFRRGPRAKVSMPDKSTRYEWEIENELTQDFVDRVKDGTVDAANQNGISDFQWVAIIDKATDDCCLWRDGLSSTEIAAQLEGDHKDDECQATVPPAHFRCRCRPVPMSADLPETEPADYGGFDKWLNSIPIAA